VSAEKFLGGGNKKQRPSSSVPRQPFLISSGGLEAVLGNCLGPDNLKEIVHHGPRIKVKTFFGETPISKKYLLLSNFQAILVRKNVLPITPVDLNRPCLLIQPAQ